MEEKQLRELLLERLHLEMKLFKDLMLCKAKENIYNCSYKIVVCEKLYDILMCQSGQMKEPLLRKLLYQRSGILDDLYEEWMRHRDSFYTELSKNVKDELRKLAEGRTDGRKEDENGEKYHKAA